MVQIIADITGKRFSVVKDPRNAGAVGAAIVALIGLGELPGFGSPRTSYRLRSIMSRIRSTGKYIMTFLMIIRMSIMLWKVRT